MRTPSSRTLHVECLEDRRVPAGDIVIGGSTLPSNATMSVLTEPAVVVGSQSGGAVQVVTSGDPSETRTLFPFGDSFTGGISVATNYGSGGHTNIVAGAGAGGSPRVVILDSTTGEEVRSFYAFDPSFTGGVNVTTGYITNDWYPDIIVAAGAGGAPHVKVFDGQTGEEVRSFYAYDRSFTGGVRVAAADIDHDYHDEIVTAPGSGGGPNIRVFDGTTSALRRSFFAYDSSYFGGVNIAAGDVNNDGFDDIITGAAAGSSHVKLFDGQTASESRSFYAFAPNLPGGVSVASGEYNADFASDIIVGTGLGEVQQVRVIDGLTGDDLGGVEAGELAFAGGVNVGLEPIQLSISIPVPTPVPSEPESAKV